MRLKYEPSLWQLRHEEHPDRVHGHGPHARQGRPGHHGASPAPLPPSLPPSFPPSLLPSLPRRFSDLEFTLPESRLVDLFRRAGLVVSLKAARRWQAREFFIDNLLVRIRFTMVMIRWTGLAPWEFESLFQVALHLPSEAGGDVLVLLHCHPVQGFMRAEGGVCSSALIKP